MKLLDKGVTKCGEFSLQIESESWNVIRKEIKKADSIETGGILIGYYTEDFSTVIITGATPPPKDSKQGPTNFERGTLGLKSLLSKLWNGKENRRYYVGEWHYHPSFEVVPSGEDKDQMVEISYDNSYQCKEPLMIIVGKEKGRTVPIRAFVVPQDRDLQEFKLTA